MPGSMPFCTAAFVTGASTGIGASAALALAKKGFMVFAGVRREQDAAALADAASLQGVSIVPVIVVRWQPKPVAAQIWRDGLFARRPRVPGCCLLPHPCKPLPCGSCGLPVRRCAVVCRRCRVMMPSHRT